MKTQLTREESRHLLDLGVPKEKASGIDIDNFDNMVLLAAEAKGNGNGDKTIRSLSTPIFKLEDFLNGEILPKEIMLEKQHGLDFGWDFCLNKWVARYCDEDALCPYEYAWYLKEELIDALYQLACWYYGEYLKSEKK